MIQMTIYDLMRQEKVYELDVRGICDDAYCPNCNYGFFDAEADCERCPKCGVKVSWQRWHTVNDEQKKDCETCAYRVYLHPPKGGKPVRSCDRYGGCEYKPKDVHPIEP